MATINGHYDVAGLLLDQGADPNIADETGRTALYAAVDMHTMPASNRPSPNEVENKLTSMDLIQSLLAHGANVNVQLKKMKKVQKCHLLSLRFMVLPVILGNQ